MQDRILLLLKGMAMGGADVIPGVSGGTIALITGIYEKLISSIKSIDGATLRLLLSFRIRAFWEKINGTFLVNVLLGILISIFSFARVITYLLEHHPIPLWSFFFGLILVSVYYVVPRERTFKDYAFLFVGIVIAYVITVLSPTETPNDGWFIFLSGAIAICAMILPGISGSFILLLLGKYEYVLNAVMSFDIITIIIFGMGCLIGIVSFSKFIYWLLKHYKGVTLSLLAGFMLGSLNKVWPWKIGEGDRSFNVLPGTFETFTGTANQLDLAIVFMIFGVILVVLLEWLGTKISAK